MKSYHTVANALYRLITAAPMMAAAARARQTRHRVSRIADRMFKVNSTRGGHYTVAFKSVAAGTIAHCDCPGFEKTICRHVASAYQLDYALTHRA